MSVHRYERDQLGSNISHVSNDLTTVLPAGRTRTSLAFWTDLMLLDKSEILQEEEDVLPMKLGIWDLA